MSTDGLPNLYDAFRTTVQPEQGSLESRLRLDIQARFANAEEAFLKAIEQVVQAEVAKVVMNGQVSGSDQRGKRDAAFGDGVSMNVRAVAEQLGLTTINSKLEELSARLAALETQVLSIMHKDEEHRTTLGGRLQLLEGLMNAILSDTAQGKRFVAENFRLDPIKYQEALQRQQAKTRDELLRLSQGWRQRTATRKRELEGDAKRRQDWLARLGREMTRAEREYVEAIAREGTKDKTRFEDLQCDEQKEVGDDSTADTEGCTAGWKAGEDSTNDGMHTGETDRGGEVPEYDGGVEEGIERDAQSNEVKRYWKKYEQQGKADEAPLSLDDICWPMLVQPLALSTMEQLNGAIESFLLSPLHSQDVSPKKRINAALLRWHPDKGAGLLRRLQNEDDREFAMEVITLIAVCLVSMREGV